MTPEGSNLARRGRVYVALVAAASAVALVVLPPNKPAEVRAGRPPATSASTTVTLPPTTAASTTTTTTTTTSIPPVEAFVPLTVDAVIDQIAPSVAFVLTQQGTGSGVVISDGLLITNAHVVWPDQTVSLVFLNGATFQGRVLAIDPFVDLAVVDISRLSRKPPAISLGSTADVAVGDSLWVVGYPQPSEFTPEPSVDIGELTQFADWEFSGLQWFTVAAPAVGGQSGGAVVDAYGRLVGISTFGSTASLTSIGVGDVVARVDEMLESTTVRGLEPRQIPHSGARRTLDVSLQGVWDQALFVGWLPADVPVAVSAPGSGINLAVRTIDGAEITEGSEELVFAPGLAFPVVLAAQAAGQAAGEIEVSLPFIALVDPDHGKTLERTGTVSGVYDVGRDRDFFYLELPEGDRATITVESAARTHLWVYSPDGEVVAEDVDESGFIGGRASVELQAQIAGRYVIAVESRLASIAGYSVVTR